MVAAACTLILINLLTVWSFWSDKARAVAGRRRIPEKDLLFLALIGGSPGAFAARRWFRHKTRKQPFSSQLTVIAVLQVAAGLWWSLHYLDPLS